MWFEHNNAEYPISLVDLFWLSPYCTSGFNKSMMTAEASLAWPDLFVVRPIPFYIWMEKRSNPCPNVKEKGLAM